MTQPTGSSTKSVSVIRKRTRPANLIRKDVEIEEIDEKDEKLLYIAYRLNQLPWKARSGIKPYEFGSVLGEFIQEHHHYAWSLRKSGEPMGAIFGVDYGYTILLGDTVWHPKTNNREKLELVAALLDKLRKQSVMILRSKYEHKSFYERLVDYKILRRVGTIYDVPEFGKAQMEFQTRSL